MPKLPYLSPPNKNFRHLECNRAGAASGAAYQDRPSEKSLIYGRRDFLQVMFISQALFVLLLTF
jgi:hypothetical protein